MAELCLRHDCLCILDEVYEHLTFPGRPSSAAAFVFVMSVHLEDNVPHAPCCFSPNGAARSRLARLAKCLLHLLHGGLLRTQGRHLALPMRGGPWLLVLD